MHRLRNVVLQQKLVSATADQTVQAVCTQMAERRVGAVCVLDGDALVGIFSERDLMTRVVVRGLDAHGTRIAEVMTRDVVTATLDDPVEACLEMMQKAGCRHLPVVVDGEVVAMISMRDLLRDELEEQDREIRGLREYLHQPPLS